jgi:rhodanese-related sulfurtransferase
MTVTSKDLVDAAMERVPSIAPQKAREMMEERGALLLDVRDAPELQSTGSAVGAHHVARGMLEFRADPDSPLHDRELRRDRPVVVHCAAGPRAALAGSLLLDMGYGEVYNMGGFKDWKAAGLPTNDPVDPGM